MTVVKNEPIISFVNKTIMAPMVRVGTLPMRLLALEFGADIVYSEELIDLKLMKAIRRVNSVLGTVDFVDPSDGGIIYRTCDIEKGKNVLQLGTSDPERALLVGKLVENDVAALDINMGCPKEFSIKGGMGAALMSDPEKAKNILKMLVDNLHIPVTCKIRILPKLEDTINLVNELASTGIAAIGIHGRTRNERPRDDPHIDVIRKVVESVKIPVIGNGGSLEIYKYQDIEKFRQLCGTSSVMIARAAQFNVSIFHKHGLLPIDDVITKYLRHCIDYDNSPSNTKYCVQSMLRDQQESPKGKRFLLCQTLQSICEVWNLGDYCKEKQTEYHEKGNFGRRDVMPCQINKTDVDNVTDEPDRKKLKISQGNDEIILRKNVAFYRLNYSSDPELPKTILHLYANKNSIPLPKYETQQEDKLFRTILTFNGKKYASTYWEKNKKYAEQGAALVCNVFIGLANEELLIENGSILR